MPASNASTIAVLRTLVAQMTPAERIRLGWLVGAFGVSAGLEFVGIGLIPVFMASLMEASALTGVHPGLADWLAGLGPSAPYWLAGILVAAFVVKFLWVSLTHYYLHRHLRGVVARLQIRYLQDYLFQDYAWALGQSSSQFQHHLQSHLDQAYTSVLLQALQLLKEGLVVLAVIALLLVQQPLIYLPGLFALGVAAWVLVRTAKKMAQRYGLQEYEGRQQLWRLANEAAQGLKILRITGAHARLTAHSSDAAAAIARSGAAGATLQLAPRLLLEVLAVSGVMAVALSTLASGLPKAAVIPILALFCVGMVRLIPSANLMLAALNHMSFCLPAVRDYLAHQQQLRAHPYRPPSAEMPRSDALIELEEVSYRYPNSAQQALGPMSLQLPRQGLIGLIGSSGSGKSTLVDLCMGILNPTSGQLRFRPEALRAAYVPQDAVVIDDTLAANIAFGLPPEQHDLDRIRAVIRECRLQALVESLPAGLDTKLGERGARLSGGQRQRICIARALYGQPQVLFMDEATSALDNFTEMEVMHTIESLARDHLVILIAHRLGTVRQADRILVLEEGRITAAGSHEVLLQQSTAYQALLDPRKAA